MRDRSTWSPRGLALVVALTAVASLALTGSAVATSDDGLPSERLVQVTVPNQAALDDLVGGGYDLGESISRNEDGSITLQLYGTDDEIAEVEAQGNSIGETIEDENTWRARLAERQEAIDAAKRAADAAQFGTVSSSGKTGLRSLAAATEVTIQRVDYYESYAGRFLSVEAFDAATNGTGTSGPTLAVSWKPAGGDYGSASNMSRYIDSDPTPDAYLYHRITIRISGLGSTAPPPAFVRVATSTAGVAPVEAPVNLWNGGDLPPLAAGFQSHFFDHYMDPTEGNDKINALANEFPNIAQIVNTPAPTNGYRRKAMGTFTYANTTLAAASAAGATNIKVASVTNLAVGNALTVDPGTANSETRTIATVGTAGAAGTGVTLNSALGLAHASGAPVFADLPIGNSATNTGSAVVFYSDAWDDNAVQVEFLKPAAADSPLSVAVLGKRITVNLATTSSALASTAAQVVAALNADPGASALVDAYTSGGNAGASIVQPHALTNLSDFLNAPASVARAPFHIQALRIGKHRDGSKTGVFVYCEEHAREWVTPLVCLETAERLVRNYGVDPLTTELVDNLDIFIIPTINPDGSHYSFYNSSGQRRNMTNHCSLATASGMPNNRNSWGVDNNRNFSVGSIFDGYFGASSSCTSDTFSGPSELSEPENQSEISIPARFPNIKFSMNVHSSGGLFMWSPAAYTGAGRVPLPYPNIGIEGYFWATAGRVLDRIKQYRGNVIDPQQTGPVIDVLYSAAGNSSDEMYYKFNIISYDFEVGNTRLATTLSSAVTAGATNVKVGSVSGFAVGAQIQIDTRQPALNAETRTITAVGTSGSGGTGITFTPALSFDHPAGAEVLGGTGTQGSGFMPNYETEGQHEAMEFAAGNYGILERALDYQRDHDPPVATTNPADGTASQTPIDVTFNWVNEPSIIHYTLDGSTPTMSSPTWEAQGPRRPGEFFHLTSTTTIKWFATDIPGNTSAIQSARFAVETEAPTTTASLSPAAVGGFYRNPTVSLVADDNFAGGGSGIASTEYNLDGAGWQTYSGPFQVTGDGSHTLDYRSTDKAGNVEATQTVTFNVDATAPSITIGSPTHGASYLIGSNVAASYSCSDALSGLASCAGPVASGSNIDTVAVGFHTFTVTAGDNAGNTSTSTLQYNVHWPFTGFQPPLNKTDQSAGDKLPVKFSLGGNRGLSILAIGSPSSAPAACAGLSPRKAVKVRSAKLKWKIRKGVRKPAPTEFGPLSYNAGTGLYTIDWYTDKAWKGTCRTLSVSLVDNTTHTATFRFK
jgi:hypothetical protein